MVVFALGVHHFAERSGGVKFAGREHDVAIRARLEHTVLFAGFLDRFVKQSRLLRLAAPKRRNRARDVFARVHRRDAAPTWFGASVATKTASTDLSLATISSSES